MEHLHAPWRMEYIGGEPAPGCLFCRVVAADPAEDVANLVLWRPPGALVMLNKFPYNSGHLLVAPVLHVSGLETLDDSASLELVKALRAAIGVLASVLRPDGFNIGANLGVAAGAGIPDHLHLHAVPRWSGDTNFMPVLGDVKIVNEQLLRTAEKVRQGFAAAGLTNP